MDRGIGQKMLGQKGISIVFVTIAMFSILAFAALAIDIGYLFVVRNELQNAADAGALAGARFLYNSNGAAVNPDCNAIAYNAAIANRSQQVPVDVHWSGGNTGDVERGHWSFATRTFTPNSSLAPVDLWNVSNAELDANPNFINAVRVRTRREDTPAASFFARIFGYQNFNLSTESVAYIGFAGTLAPGEGDQPIVICEQSLEDSNGRYYCRARMINSGPGITSDTAAWTNFDQAPGSCPGGAANASSVRPLVCGSGNPVMLTLGDFITTNGGEIQSAFDTLIDCWKGKTDTTGDRVPDVAWKLTLPVIDCSDGNPGPCNELKGAVNVSILWITGSGDQASNNYKNVPKHMEGWTCDPGSTNEQCWNSFVKHFKICYEDGITPFPYMQKTIYFYPSCDYNETAGGTGGENFGVLAKIPVLVK